MQSDVYWKLRTASWLLLFYTNYCINMFIHKKQQNKKGNNIKVTSGIPAAYPQTELTNVWSKGEI